MAVRQFAIPLDGSSIQTGNITFETLEANGAGVDFKLTNVTASMSTNKLDLVTKKNSSTKSHEYTLSFTSGVAKASVSKEDIATIYADADGGDWDYVEAKWTVGETDTPITSVLEMEQSNKTFDFTGWPPKTAS